MKNNTFKRVLAGSLALLTVAAPMTANVEGILQEVAIIANAVQNYQLTVSWDKTMCDYIQSITVGEETISGTQVSKSTNYQFANAAGVVSTIVTTVPIEGMFNGQGALAALKQNTGKTTDQDYKFEKGQWRVSEKNGVFTYDIYTPDADALAIALNNSTSLAIVGDKSDITINAFNGKTANDITNTWTSPDSFSVTSTANDKTTPTNAVVASDANASSSGEFYTNGVIKLTSAENFVVRVFDGTKSTSVVNATVEYDIEKNEYVSTFKVPTFTAGTAVAYKDATGVDVAEGNYSNVIIEVIEQNPEVLTYTASDNYLYANGNTVAANTVAAQITAKQYRAEVKDAETAAIIDPEIKESDLAYNGSFKYGTGANDGVTVTVKKDAKLTVKNTNAGTDQNANAVFTVTKDGAIFGTWDNKNMADTDFTNNEFTFPKFTEAGTYVITAKFYYDAANGGVDSKTINYKFTINPIEVAADDVAISFDYVVKDANGNDVAVAQNTNANLVTPTPAYFNEKGVLQITVPDELKGTTFNAHVTVPVMDEDALKKYQAEFDKFVAGIEVAQTLNSATSSKRLHVTFANGTTTYASAGSYVISTDKKTVTATGDFASGAFANVTKTFKRDTITELPALNDSDDQSASTKGAVIYQGYKAQTNDYRYEIDGTLTATEFNSVNTVKVLVYDQNYGAPYDANGKKYKTITVEYELVKAAQEPAIELLTEHPDVDDADRRLKVAAADCKDLEAFEDIFWNNFKGNEIVEENKDKISFEYLEGVSNSAGSDDLDSHNPGLPTKKSDINYTLFVLFDGETFASLPLEVVNTKAMIVPAEAELTKTFGDKVELGSYTLQDSNGKKLTKIKLTNNVNIQVLGTAKDKNVNTKAIDPYKDSATGKYVLETAQNMVIKPTQTTLLDAGTYVVKFTSKVDSDADYTVNSEEYILVIEKRELTADMFTAPNKYYDSTQANNQQTVEVDDFTFRYTDGNEENYTVDNFSKVRNNVGAWVALGGSGSVNSNLFKVSGGDTKGTGIGQYTIKISALESNKNFTGTANVNWYIAYEEDKTTGIAFNWQDEDIWLYDNGRIHATYEPTIVPKTGYITDAQGKKVTVKDYGVICDKDAKIAAPTFVDKNADSTNSFDYEDQKKGGKTKGVYATAAATLLYGNGYIEGHASDDCWKRGDYGANISVKSTDKGIWVRPYILLSNDKVVYGDPIYLDIVKEAEKQLQFKLNPTQKLDKTNNLPGYDNETGKYVFYSSYKKFDSKVQAKVKDFGVIVDKKGSFKTVTDGTNHIVVSADDTKTTIEDAFKCGKGFVEGHFNPNNEVLGANEYGAKIKPQDTVTGVWVRGYIKLSDDLIVYTDPEYYNSVSDYYAKKAYPTRNDAFEKYMASDANHVNTYFGGNRAVAKNQYKEAAVTPVADIKYTNTTGVYTISFTNNVKANNTKLEFVAQGVVVDKNESLVNRTYQKVNNADAYVFEIRDAANTKFVLGKGYVEGKKTNATADYKATVSPVSGRAITVRPYTTFKVAGTDTTVTVYGEPKVAMNDGTTAWSYYNYINTQD